METAIIKLNTSAFMPPIGFGTWRLNDGDEAKSATKQALEAGYRLLDTAAIYGNEESVGAAIRESGVERKEIFVTTKLWTGDQGYDSALKAFDNSLKKLGLEYIDLYLIHWPGDNSQKRKESWQALQKLHKDGLAKAIGVSNYYVEELTELFEYSEVVPAVNQIQFHPFVYKERGQTLKFCKDKNITVEAYSPLARGYQLEHPKIAEIAEEYKKTNAQVMLRWATQHQTIPIPKTAHLERMKENIEIFDFKLSDQDMNIIDSLS